LPPGSVFRSSYSTNLPVTAVALLFSLCFVSVFFALRGFAFDDRSAPPLLAV
jgi:hypothetical protein